MAFFKYSPNLLEDILNCSVSPTILVYVLIFLTISRTNKIAFKNKCFSI